MGHDENEKQYVTDFSLPSASFAPTPSSLDAWNKDINRLHFGKDLDSCMKTLACIVNEYDDKKMDHLQCQTYHLALDWLQTLKDRLENANRTMGAIKMVRFSTVCADSDGTPVPGTACWQVLVYNENAITAEEVDRLLKGGCAPELDDRVTVMTPAQAKALFPMMHETEDDQNEH